ncbi:PTS sugar transporter subunit IIA [Shouchella shacheensis]|uniref:PTS sugar transporter subunit IIA n=1 Tax=Shouchella shacheensis TaxID=1649580 RepID=UPI00073FF42C|nr:PTS sugar transporter subunit IIA [Shouchella shacheensis]
MSERLVDGSTILLDVEGETKEEILTKMGRNLVENKLVKESFIDAVVAREGEFPTGLPTGSVSVAIPHTDVEHVRKKTISVAVLREPVKFGVMGGDETETTPVKIVFMLAMDEAHSQLNLLQQLMQIFQSEEKLMKIVNATNQTELKTLLQENLAQPSLKGGE